MIASKNKNRLPRSTPEEQGVASSGILSFIDAVEQAGLELHSMMLLRRGSVIAEGWWTPYRAELPHMLFSLSKSFASSGVGLAAQEGLLSVDDFVVSFFPEHEALYDSNENLKRMRVRHLLSMSTGHEEDTTGRLREGADGDWVRAFLSLPVEREPGTHFVYNSGASYMLSAIVQQVSGKTLLEFLLPRLFEPLGIEEPTWETCPRGISTGGWGLSIRTEDIARFGQMYLQKGVWQGKQILSEAWVEEATSLTISNGDGGASDWAQGYGYQFWRCRHGAYRGDGAFGQYCIVMPEQEAVLAITSGLDNMQAVLDNVWEHLLPTMAAADALPRAEDHGEALRNRLETLAIQPPQHRPTSPIAEQVSGRPYRISGGPIESGKVTFQFGDSQTSIVLDDGKSEHIFSCGIGEWMEGTSNLYGSSMKVLASGTWSEDQTYVATLRYVETPFVETYRCTFIEDLLKIEPVINVSFGSKERPAIEGSRL
jgi:hypothetical protein